MEQLRHTLYLITCVLIILLALAGADAAAAPSGEDSGNSTIHYFWGVGCPHCAEAKPFLDGLARKYPSLRIKSYEVFDNPQNVDLLRNMARERGAEARSVPAFIIGNTMISGFNDYKGAAIEAEVRSLLARSHGDRAKGEGRVAETLTIPLLGSIDPESTALPLFTLCIAALDSFNPCAFFVLLFLLSLLIHTHSRLRMALIGGIFVLSSGIVYFVFMAAWLNIFLLVGTMRSITVAAGVIALVVAAINIKDFFFFEQGVSLVIPEEKKPRLFDRMRRLVRSPSLPSMLAGTVVLAVAANSYELLCTAGFPMVFTRVLTLREFAPSTYYLYLFYYNVVYVIPLAVIVAIFTVTLGSRKLSEWQGRVLKLLSGVMMLMLGTVILLKPALLGSAATAVLLLGFALLITLIISTLSRRLNPDIARNHGDHH